MKIKLEEKVDERGVLVECFPGVFYIKICPGQTRGNHYHKRKTEEFVSISGQILACTRKQGQSEGLADILMDKLVVEPMIVHSFTNIGQDEAIMLVKASEIFNPEDPDTYYEKA